nr:retrotransposon protein, putative, Ty1-copia subclass [Tanacetum cinerariifolium]
MAPRMTTDMEFFMIMSDIRHDQEKWGKGFYTPQNPNSDKSLRTLKEELSSVFSRVAKKKKNAASGAGGSGIFVIELNTILNRSWIYDTVVKDGKETLHTSSGKGQRLTWTNTHRWVSMSQEFLDHLKDHGIIAHRTPPYTPQHNGVSDRKNRTLLDMVRSMMSQITLPKSFWDYALKTTARILNMVPNKKVKKTPYDVWYELTPKLSYLKV